MSVPRRAKNAGKSPAVEQWLNDHGVEWEYYPNFPIEEIDLEKSLHNQARMFEPLDDAVVQQYAEAMQRGDLFPGVVLARTNQRQRATEVDGNHRTHGMLKAGGDGIDAYVITKARPSILVQMTFEANVKHGKPTSHEERLSQAVWLIDNGANREQAAAAVNIKKSDLDRAWNRLAADRRADEIGVDRRTWDALPQGHRVRLNQVITDEGLRAAVNLTFRANLSQEEVFQLVGELNKVRSSSRQVGIVKNWESTFADRIQASGAGVTATGRRARTPKQALGMALSSIETLPDNLDVIAERYLGEEREEAAKRAREASTRLAALADRLDALASV